jgi:hypothetical protein
MDIAIYTIRAVAGALVDPYLVLMLALLGLMLYTRNKKTTDMQKMIMGESTNSPLELTISQIVIGIFAGLICSLIMSYLGVMFDDRSAISLIFIISIFLMLWKPRLICFSYSGAILGLLSLILTKVSTSFSGSSINIFGASIKLSEFDILKIDIVALITMIGVIHIIEGLLVIVDGHKGAIPIFSNRDEKIIGGFAMQRYWVLPIALLFVLSNPQEAIGPSSPLPGWWPLIKTNIPDNLLKDAVLSFLPFYGVLGYSNITFTMDKKKKTLTSGAMILVYGIVLAFLAQVARFGFLASLLVIIFMPLAHEGMLMLQHLMEMKGAPKFVSNDDGVMVLEVSPNSPAEEMGIKSGDRLLEVNNSKIVNEEEILNTVREGVNFIWFKIKQTDGKLKDVSYNRMNSVKRLGIVFVPRGLPKDSTVVKFDGTKFSDILNKFKNKDK